MVRLFEVQRPRTLYSIATSNLNWDDVGSLSNLEGILLIPNDCGHIERLILVLVLELVLILVPINQNILQLRTYNKRISMENPTSHAKPAHTLDSVTPAFCRASCRRRKWKVLPVSLHLKQDSRMKVRHYLISQRYNLERYNFCVRWMISSGF